MAGLFDFLMQQQGQPQGGGLLGNVGGWLGNNQDALVAMGLGMAGGATPMEGFKGGMQGYLSGRKSDQSRTAGEQFIKEMGLGVAPSSGPFSKPSPALGPMPVGTPQAVPQSGPQFAMPPIDPTAPRIVERGPQGMPIYDPKFASPMESEAPPVAGLNPAHRDMLIRTVLGEAANQSPEGQAAVAAVIRNRMQAGRYGGTDVPSVVQAKGQFEPWGNPEARAGMLAYSQQDPRYQQVGNIVDQVISGQAPDPTNGATHFFAPKAQAALGRNAPAWAQGPGLPIGGHTFYAPEGRVQVAQAGGGPAPMPGGPAPQPGPGPQQTGAVQPVAPDQLGAIRNLPLNTVMKWAMNPNLPENMAGVAKEIFKARLEDTKMTEAQKDYMRAKVDGYQGSFAQWKHQPSFGDTGRRDEFDRPIQGWRDPTQAVGAQTGGQAEQPRAPIELVTKLRTEVQGQQSYKRLAVAMPVYNSMVDAASSDDRAADLNLIYGFATIMDPDSVVRGEEMTMVKAIATLPDQIKSEVMSQMKETGRLSPTTRAALMKQAHSRVSSYRGTFDQIIDKQYGGLVDRYRMNRADVLPDFGELRQFEPPKPTIQGGAAANPYEAEARRRGLIK
jgi:hypothetical protein